MFGRVSNRGPSSSLSSTKVVVVGVGSRRVSQAKSRIPHVHPPSSDYQTGIVKLLYCLLPVSTLSVLMLETPFPYAAIALCKVACTVTCNEMSRLDFPRMNKIRKSLEFQLETEVNRVGGVGDCDFVTA